jgi:hypothetical protein
MADPFELASAPTRAGPRGGVTLALAACQTTPTCAAGPRPADGDGDGRAGSRTLVDELQRPDADDADRRSAGPQPRPAGGDGARRPGALERAAGAVLPLPEPQPRRRRQPQPHDAGRFAAAARGLQSDQQRLPRRPARILRTRPLGTLSHGANAARSELLATEYARATVRTAVAAESARAYFGLLAADAELALLRDTLKSRDRRWRCSSRPLPGRHHRRLRPAAGAGGTCRRHGQPRGRRTRGRHLRIGAGGDPRPFAARSIRRQD